MRSVMLSVLVLLSGCFNPAAGVQGVWLFYLDANADNPAGSTDCSENFKDGDCPAGDDNPDPGPWTYENTSDSNAQIVVGEIIGGEGSDLHLLIGGTIGPGSVAKGVATFHWPVTSSTTEGRTHESGYQYEHDVETIADTTLSLDIGEETGTIAGNNETTESWTESDKWDAFETGVYEGDIPASSWLTFDGGDSYNTSDAKECQDSDCMISIHQTSGGTVSFTATRTDYDATDPTDALNASAPD
jgi:hypothetical protein